MRLNQFLGLSAIAFVLAACGGDPAPKDVENPSTKHHKKKKHKKHTDDDEDATADAPPKKTKKKEPSAEDKRRAQEIEDEKEAEARRERIRKREQEEAEEKKVAAKDDGGGGDSASDESASSDDASSDSSSDDSDAKAEKEAKAEAAREKKKEAAAKKKEAAEKKKQAAEEAKAKREAAAEEKKQKAEEAKEKREAAAEAKKKRNKHSEEVEVASSDDESASDDSGAQESKPEKKETKSKGKAKKAKADTTSDQASEEADAEETKPEAKETKKAKAKGNGREKQKEKKEEVDEAAIEVDDSSSSLPPPDPTEESKELDLTSGAVPNRDTGEDAAPPPTTPVMDRRPLTTAKSSLEVHGGPRVAVVSASNGRGGTKSSTSEGMNLGVTYGVGAKAEVGVDYSVGLNPGSAKGPFLLHGAYAVKTSEKLDIALSAGFAIDFISAPDPAMPTMLTTRTAKAFQLGIWARYHVTPKASLFSGLPALPASSGSLAGAAALPPITHQLSVGLGSREAIALEVPVGLGYQLTPKFYGVAMLDLAHLGMSNSTSAFIFADYIPIGLGGFYAKDKLDIGAVFSDDLKQPGGFLQFNVVLRYRVK